MTIGTSDRVTASAPGPAGGSRFLQAVEPWVYALVGILIGLAAGWAALRFSGTLHLRLSLVDGIALSLALLAAWPIARWPTLGVVALVLVAYLNLSDILIRFHDLPSVQQLLMIPLIPAVIAEWRRGNLRGLRPRAVTVALAVYVLVLVVSSTVAREPRLADARAVEAAKGFAIFMLILLLANRPERVRAGAWALIAGALILAGLSLTQVLTGAFEYDFGGLARTGYGPVYANVREARLAGPVGDANFFAQILVIVVPVALVLAWKERTRGLRVLALGVAAATAAATMFTYSRGGALSLAAVVVCSLFAAHPSKRRVTVGAALILLAGLVAVPHDFAQRLVTLRQLLPDQEQVLDVDSSFRVRLLFARVAWRLFLDHPTLGVGAGNYGEHYYEYADEIGSTAAEYDKAGGPHYPHNLYLEQASETGFLGLISFGTMLLLVFGHLDRAKAGYFATGDKLHAALASALAIALLGFLVSSLFLHGHFQRYLWMLLGLSAALAGAAPVVTAAPLEDGGTLAGARP